MKVVYRIQVDDDDDLSRFLLGLATSNAALGGS